MKDVGLTLRIIFHDQSEANTDKNNNQSGEASMVTPKQYISLNG
jgi:hypothetical protein